MISLIPSAEYSIYERRYKDIFTEIAAFGGVLDVIYAFGFIIIFIFVKENFNDAMIQDFYDLDDANFENNKIQEFEEVIQHIYNCHRNFSFNKYYKTFIIEAKEYDKNNKKMGYDKVNENQQGI